MKVRVLIGLLVVSTLSVYLVSAQDSAPATASGQKAAAACCSGTATAKLTSVAEKATACCSDAATAKLTSVDGKATACCSGATTAKLASVDGKATACSGAATAKLASATPGCPLQAAGIQLTSLQQGKIQAILAQARKDLLAVLSGDQQAKFAKFAKVSELSLMPVVFAQQASLTTSTATSTQPCCAAKIVAQTGVCPADCQKPCCASKTQTVAEQTTCPIMGSPIKKTVFTVYQGKKVYFCCPGCDKAFNKNPEKYTKNLPQF